MPFPPKKAAKSCIRRARRFLSLAEHDSLPDPKVRQDLRRMAIVMAVAAIDSYMHGVVLGRLGSVRRRQDLPKPLQKLDIAFGDLAQIADSFIRAQQADQRTRPWVKVKAVLQRQLQGMTLQNFDQVAAAFAMAGVPKAWTAVAAQAKETCDKIKHRLNQLVHRRNQIVHEGDVKRAARPRQLAFNRDSHTDVAAEVEWVDGLIAAMQKVLDAAD